MKINMKDINKLEPFKNHPFKVKDDLDMQELEQNIKNNGDTYYNHGGSDYTDIRDSDVYDSSWDSDSDWDSGESDWSSDW